MEAYYSERAMDGGVGATVFECFGHLNPSKDEPTKQSTKTLGY